ILGIKRNQCLTGVTSYECFHYSRFVRESIICVKGNCDSEVDQMVLEFPILSDYSSLFFEELGGKMIYLTHGHHPAPPMQEGDILVSGHTHIPVATEQEGIFLVNPGSVAIPKGGFPPSYCIYSERTFTIMDFEDNTLMKLRV
ncbi:MAG: phosphodiesterase, partial [Sphaerochaeta sp.]|nr:phosphodiesterase [Sphaerochaeta sp.]